MPQMQMMVYFIIPAKEIQTSGAPGTPCRPWFWAWLKLLHRSCDKIYSLTQNI